MKTIAPTDHAPAEAAAERYSTGSVVSKDGTIIGYRQVGRGPAVILLHGAMESAQSHMQLAQALADRFTIYLPDRRGRGLSGPYQKGHSIETDVEDMAALLARADAHDVMGVSSGAIIWLEAALTLPIRKAVIFEPPLPINGSLPTDFVQRYEREIAQGEVAAALVSAMKGTQMGPPIFNIIPRGLMERLTMTMMANEEKKAGTDDVTMRMLAPTLHYDFQLATEMEGALERFKAIRAEVLLLGGSKSPAYLKAGLDALATVLPNATRVELPGLGHGATGNTDRGGRPERAAEVLRQFFG
jgi:pimeloyl-ACP methyl ester carboxylesterase